MGNLWKEISRCLFVSKYKQSYLSLFSECFMVRLALKPVAFLLFVIEDLSPVEGTVDPEQYLSKLLWGDKNSMQRRM